MDPVYVPLRSCVYRFDPPCDLRFSSSATVDNLVRWFCLVLARRLDECLLQQDLPDSDEGGVMKVTRLSLASVFVVIARWSMDLVVFLVTSGVLCIAMIEDE